MHAMTHSHVRHDSLTPVLRLIHVLHDTQVVSPFPLTRAQTHPLNLSLSLSACVSLSLFLSLSLIFFFLSLSRSLSLPCTEPSVNNLPPALFPRPFSFTRAHACACSLFLPLSFYLRLTFNRARYGVATISRLLEIIGLFCR